ncbi:MAG: MFS transporter, partial [Clostridiales bacterium]|nr:MFS transporter [Clostridiales bacterium]
MGSENRSYVTTREFMIYGIANGGQCMSYNTLTGYLTYFFVNVFNIDARIVSTMLFLEGIWDTVNDPLMGMIVDKTRTRWGKLRPFLLGVPIPLAVTTALLFSGPLIVGNYSPTDYRKVIYMVITYFAWEFMYTIGDVPFWGLSTAISPNPNDRTKAITSARLISSIVGGLPTLFIPILLDLVSGGHIGTNLRVIFCLYSIVTSSLGMGLFSMSGLFVKERVIQSEEQPSLLESLKCLVTNRPLRILILKDILSALGGIGGVFSTYYLVDVLGSA